MDLDRTNIRESNVIHHIRMADSQKTVKTLNVQ